MEEQMRFSSTYQEKCNSVEKIPNGWLFESGKIQEQVAFRFGYTDILTNNDAVNYIRRAQNLYPEEIKFKQIPVYIRENRAVSGNFNIGEKMKLDLNIYNLKLENKKTNDLLVPSKHNIIIASSNT